MLLLRLLLLMLSVVTFSAANQGTLEEHTVRRVKLRDKMRGNPAFLSPYTKFDPSGQTCLDELLTKLNKRPRGRNEKLYSGGLCTGQDVAILFCPVLEGDQGSCKGV